MPQFNRQTAVPCTLAELSSGAWIQNQGLIPSGIQTQRCMIARASILGVIIDKQENSFILEDGTGLVHIRSFDAKPVPVLANVGDVVLVIGRPREYNAERYLVLEICKKLRNPSWIQYRKRELELMAGISVPVQKVHVERPFVEVNANTKNPFEIIMDKIRELDKGQGATIDDLVKVVENAESFIKTLLEEGEIFEIRPGIVKVLE